MSGMDRKLFTRPASDDASDPVVEPEACANAFPARLIAAGLRPTRQRVALGELLFGRGDRHVTAERLFEEATAARLSVSLATVYNTLHQFTAAGILREIAVDGARVYFDTNTSDHHHFLRRGRRRALRHSGVHDGRAQSAEASRGAQGGEDRRGGASAARTAFRSVDLFGASFRLAFGSSLFERPEPRQLLSPLSPLSRRGSGGDGAGAATPPSRRDRRPKDFPASYSRRSRFRRSGTILHRSGAAPRRRRARAWRPGSCDRWR